MEISLSKVDLPTDGAYKYFDFPEAKMELLVFNDSGNYRIYSSFCPHFGGPLEVKNGKLFCSFHDYIYDMDTGSCINKELGAKCQILSFFEEDNSISVVVE